MTDDQTKRRIDRLRAIVIALVIAGFVLMVAWANKSAAAGGEARQTHTQVRIPSASWQYQRAVINAEQEFHGIHANPARLAALLHQESAWNPRAQSPYAQGLAQFVPTTAAWLPEVCPEVGRFDPWDPHQSVRASACYQRHLRRSIRDTADECHRWAMVLAAYNGGLGWINRDRRLAAERGADPSRWWGHVELHTRRAEWAKKENRGYPRRILLTLEPAYLRAGWAGTRTCTVLG